MFHMKHLFFLKRIITQKKNSGIGMIPEFLYREEKKKEERRKKKEERRKKKEERRLLSDFASGAYPA